jgi:hypothetical protein
LIVQGPEEDLFKYLTSISEKFEEAVEWTPKNWTGMERRIGPGGGLNGGWAMARHRSFGSEFKRQLAKEFLDGRAGLH